MSQDPIRQLLDLVAVHGFYLSLLEAVTGEPVPVPRGAGAAEHQASLAEESIALLRRWLNILDMAITPPMVRDELKASLSPATAEALLRYYVLKTSHTDVDRDKADCVNTLLYRGWRKQAGKHDDAERAILLAEMERLEYEGEIYIMLGEVEPPALPQEHSQLAREFEHLQQEADDFRHFDQLMDSGIIPRVRELKQRFAKSFYHPRVLSTVAVYNHFFGLRFDELFHAAASEIKTFAQKVQQEGGSIMGRVEGDVTVQQLAQVEAEEEEMLEEEYGKAREKFRQVAEFKKAVDIRRKGRYSAPAPPPTGHRATVVPITAATAQAMASAVAPDPLPSPAPSAVARSEDAKIENMTGTLRTFVITAEASFANVVPLRNTSILLTPAEVEAFRNGYEDEKSFRADFAAVLRQLAAVQACMLVEMEMYRGKRQSAYLWKPHADSLAHLMKAAGRAVDEGRELGRRAEARGLFDKLNQVTASIERLGSLTSNVAKTLQA